MKDKPELDALELAIRARNGSLHASERDALTQALATSAVTRIALELGSDLDLVNRVQPGDEALIERAFNRALTTTPARRPRRVWLGAGLVAATLVIASVAAATRGVLGLRAGATAPMLTTTAATRTLAPAPPSPRRARAEAPSLPAEPSATEASAAEASAAPVPVRPTAPRPSPESAAVLTPAARISAPTAESLFLEAGAARRTGDLTRARTLYLELQTLFPASSEASVSRVSLGKLLLRMGHAREADAAFAGYLQSGARDLRAEALVGRADALLALGRSADERRVRQELVDLYPTSVYASRAQERIAEIDRADRSR